MPADLSSSPEKVYIDSCGAFTVIDCVTAAAPYEIIGTIQTRQEIVSVISRQGIAEGATPQPFDADKNISFSLATTLNSQV